MSLLPYIDVVLVLGADLSMASTFSTEVSLKQTLLSLVEAL